MTQRATIAAILASGATYRGLGEALGIDPGAARMRARRAGLRTLHRTARRTQRRPAASRLPGGCWLRDARSRTLRSSWA